MRFPADWRTWPILWVKCPVVFYIYNIDTETFEREITPTETPCSSNEWVPKLEEEK